MGNNLVSFSITMSMWSLDIMEAQSLFLKKKSSMPVITKLRTKVIKSYQNKNIGKICTMWQSLQSIQHTLRNFEAALLVCWRRRSCAGSMKLQANLLIGCGMLRVQQRRRLQMRNSLKNESYINCWMVPRILRMKGRGWGRWGMERGLILGIMEISIQELGNLGSGLARGSCCLIQVITRSHTRGRGLEG